MFTKEKQTFGLYAHFTGGFRGGRKGRSPPPPLKKQKTQINIKNKWRRKKAEREKREVQSLRLKLS